MPRMKPFRPSPPVAIEKRYQRVLVSLVKELNKRVIVLLRQAMGSWASQRDIELGFKKDDFMSEIERFFTGLLVVKRALDAQAELKLSDLFDAVNRFNRIQNGELSELSVGRDIFTKEPDLAKLKNIWLKQNSDLIKNLTEEQLKIIRQVIERGLVEGLSTKQIWKELSEKAKLPVNRAKLIGADQVNKLNGQLDMHRHLAAGIDQYEWMSALDERTRRSHRVMDGMICKWDDATVYRDSSSASWQSRAAIGGEMHHPGQAVRCRCVAGAFFPDEEVA